MSDLVQRLWSDFENDPNSNAGEAASRIAELEEAVANAIAVADLLFMAVNRLRAAGSPREPQT